MTNYVISHVPHASAEVPFREHYTGDVEAERALVTDWATDRMVKADESVVFPFSRLWCDVERLVNDPLDERGLGLFTTRRLNGDILRTATEPYLTRARADYLDHHRKVVEAIAGAISLLPVCLLDVHSYADQQAGLMGLAPPYPEICLGYDDGAVASELVARIGSMFEGAGYSVGYNVPYRGALAPAPFQGNPDFFAIMIEVNKSVYLDPIIRGICAEGVHSTMIDTERFAKLKLVMDQVVDAIRLWPA